eukprot:1149713-Pelagomonas_calceolata.AAC.8
MQQQHPHPHHPQPATAAAACHSSGQAAWLKEALGQAAKQTGRLACTLCAAAIRCTCAALRHRGGCAWFEAPTHVTCFDALRDGRAALRRRSACACVGVMNEDPVLASVRGIRAAPPWFKDAAAAVAPSISGVMRILCGHSMSTAGMQACVTPALTYIT